MSKLIENIQSLMTSIPPTVSLVIATKYATSDDVNAIASNFPTIAFGENRVQQGEEKQSEAIQNPWHFIGHLQRNKVKKVIQTYQLIQSVDSERLANEINKASKSHGVVTPILLQVNPSNDPNKFGFTAPELLDTIHKIEPLQHISINGLMSMAPLTNDEQLTKKTFKKTRNLYDKLISSGLPLQHLSMGMSNDYKLAIDEGSNMIRIGKLVFS